MKHILLLAIALLTFQGDSFGHRSHYSSGISFGVFYSSLDSYGEWIQADRGVYVWRPLHVMRDWRPYTVGQWSWTDDGWYWVSDEPWGWATYHYGRWYFDNHYGWVWIPGYEWAPAWVEWRYGADYVGWAPLGPYAIFNLQIGIRYSAHWVTPHHYWSFVHCKYVASPHVYKHVYRSHDNHKYVKKTRSAGNIRHDGGRVRTAGPDRDYVVQRGKVRVDLARVVDGSLEKERIVREEGINRIETFRPEYRGGERPAQGERPRRILRGERLGLDVEKMDIHIQGNRENESFQRERNVREGNRGGERREMRSRDDRSVTPHEQLLPKEEKREMRGYQYRNPNNGPESHERRDQVREQRKPRVEQQATGKDRATERDSRKRR